MNEMLLVSPAKKNKTLLLMHMDKIGTRDYTDERGTTISVYPTAGLMRTANIGGAGYFSRSGNESGLVIPLFSWVPGNSDWTQEFWCRRFSTATYMSSISVEKNAVSIDFDSYGYAHFYINGLLVYSVTAHTVGLNNAWGHVAFVKDGSNFKLFINGVLQKTIDISSNASLQNVVFRPFSLVNIVGSHNYIQYVDELRISNVARYKENFTPQTTNFALD